MYINKAILYGNLTRDPELKSLPSGVKVTSFSIATNRTWKDKNGARQESVEYHNIVLFARLAELAAQYLRKGSGVYIEGRLQTRSWDDQGTKKYRTEIVGETMQFGPRAGGAQGDTQGKQDAPAKGSAPDQLETIEYPEEDINPDDIPF